MHSLTRKWCHTVSIKQIATSFYATISNNRKLEEHVKYDAVAEAEKLVENTSFINLKWVLNDELVSSAIHLRKLLETNHPVVNLVRDLIQNKERPSWSLIISLVAKAGGLKESASGDVISDVLHKQRTLAELTEMLKLSNLLHKCVVHLDATEDDGNMKFGNAISLLGGHYLLTSGFSQLTSIKNHNLKELIWSAYRDMADSGFIGARDKQNNPLPGRPMLGRIDITDEFGVEPIKYSRDVLGNAKPEWVLRNTLGGASLLGKSCQGVLMLAGYDKNFQKHGYLLGKYIALSLNATKEYTAVHNNKDISPVSAPVLFHMQRHPSFYSEFEKLIDEDGEVDQDKIRSELQDSPALNDTKLLQKELCERTLDILSKFQNCDAKTALTNIILSIQL